MSYRMAKWVWRAGTSEIEVRLDGRCEGGLGQQRNDYGCASLCKKIGKSGEPLYMCNCMSFAWPYVLSDRPPVLWWLLPGEEWDAVT